jgi:copper(I)-binding protein
MSLSRRPALIGLTAFIAQTLTGRSFAAPPVEVTDAWVRLGTADQPAAAAYFTVLNHGDADELVEASSPVSETVSLARTRWKGTVAHLDPVRSIPVAEVSRLTLKPGGYAAILVNPTEPLRVGAVVPLSLRFAHAGTITVDARVSNQLLGNRGR